jgi:hypothetical protein
MGGEARLSSPSEAPWGSMNVIKRKKCMMFGDITSSKVAAMFIHRQRYKALTTRMNGEVREKSQR